MHISTHNSNTDSFLSRHPGFSLREQVEYPNGGVSRFYDDGQDMVIIDENICNHASGEPVFSYMLITDKQNEYMHRFRRVFRFLMPSADDDVLDCNSAADDDVLDCNSVTDEESLDCNSAAGDENSSDELTVNEIDLKAGGTLEAHANNLQDTQTDAHATDMQDHLTDLQSDLQAEQQSNLQTEISAYLNKHELTIPADYKITVADRGEQADVSPLELHFESNFTNAYGINALRFLSREYSICDENGKNYFLDYFIRTKDNKFAVEENGVTYHHPQIIGEERYRKQLRKQNTCALWGIKLFRFSTEDCSFDTRIEDDIKQYFGPDSSEFIEDGLKVDRKVELYEHQTISLEEIKKRRKNGIKAFLIVLPTAAGKSRIVEEDLKAYAKEVAERKRACLKQTNSKNDAPVNEINNNDFACSKHTNCKNDALEREYVHENAKKYDLREYVHDMARKQERALEDECASNLTRLSCGGTEAGIDQEIDCRKSKPFKAGIDCKEVAERKRACLKQTNSKNDALVNEIEEHKDAKSDTFANAKPDFRALILVPGLSTLNDWRERVAASLPELADNIDVRTYAYMARHYTALAMDYYDYVVVDEAHHAVAPVLKRVIQHFDADFTVGLTATDQRPDRKKLETVFGAYSSSLSLREAMEIGVVAKANVYRIETNIDLSQVRFNGKDYVNADLEKRIRITSRNDLIVDVLKEYFTDGDDARKQGVIFCVNVKHAGEMARLLNQAGISAASYTGQTKNPEQVMDDFRGKKVRFLCACNMISEGWDYPELAILVMARPTLSKVLYLQQIGRGLRKTRTKENVIVIDVVDEYGAMVRACNMHTIFANPYYVPFGDITRTDYEPGEMVVVDGLQERVERITEVDINSFEDKYGDYLSQEQLAREYFVSTGTVTSWVKKGKIEPSAKYRFGSRDVYLFSPTDVSKYREELGIKVHDDSTIRDDFFEFLEERDYSLSYKMPFLLALAGELNEIGDAEVDRVLGDYIAFYQDRLDRGLPVDRKTCPYNNDFLADKKSVKRSMLTNPFEKFERKRFLYHSKDLGVISMNHALYSQLTDEDWARVKAQMREDLENYYREMGGV